MWSFEILNPASALRPDGEMTIFFSCISSFMLAVWLDLFSCFWRHHLPHHGVGPDGDEPRPGHQVQCPGDCDGHRGHHQLGGYSDP